MMEEDAYCSRHRGKETERERETGNGSVSSLRLALRSMVSHAGGWQLSECVSPTVHFSFVYTMCGGLAEMITQTRKRGKSKQRQCSIETSLLSAKFILFSVAFFFLFFSHVLHAPPSFLDCKRYVRRTCASKTKDAHTFLRIGVVASIDNRKPALFFFFFL